MSVIVGVVCGWPLWLLWFRFCRFFSVVIVVEGGCSVGDSCCCDCCCSWSVAVVQGGWLFGWLFYSDLSSVVIKYSWFEIRIKLSEKALDGSARFFLEYDYVSTGTNVVISKSLLCRLSHSILLRTPMNFFTGGVLVNRPFNLRRKRSVWSLV